jgi:hypothetical protein
MQRQQTFLSREQIAGRYHKKINGEKTNLKIAPFPNHAWAHNKMKNLFSF